MLPPPVPHRGRLPSSAPGQRDLSDAMHFGLRDMNQARGLLPTINSSPQYPQPERKNIPSHEDEDKEKEPPRLDPIKREADMIMRLVPGISDLATYWNESSLIFPAPALGIVHAEMYSPTQRVAVLQFTLFNWVLTQQRNRYFPRRTQSTNLWFAPHEPPVYRLDNVVMPVLATLAQVFDLIPTAAYHGEQIAVRCRRPESALSAAAANKSRRDAELLKETQRAVQPQPQFPQPAAVPLPPFAPLVPISPIGPPGRTHKRTPSATEITVQHAHAAMPTFLMDTTRESEAFYLQHPLRFGDDAGEAVHLGSSSRADNPAPGGVIGQKKPGLVQASPAGSFSSFEEPLPTPVDDWFGPSTKGLDLHLLSLLTSEPRGKMDTDWICSCGMSNHASATHCVRNGLGCRSPRAPAPEAVSRSVLGDPGDWYCDHCGLCNWTRRAFCLRCCPLHPDNIEEAITKGIVHYDDPIIKLLIYGDKRARALKKTPAKPPTGPGATHCACFGPHHGTRCVHAGRAVPDDLWGMYLDSQEALLKALQAATPPKPLPQLVPRVNERWAGSPGHAHGRRNNNHNNNNHNNHNNHNHNNHNNHNNSNNANSRDTPRGRPHRRRGQA